MRLWHRRAPRILLRRSQVTIALPHDEGANMAGKDGVGGKIARIREARKLTQAELAERSQVALGLVQQIEEGALIPSLTPLTRIARVLGVRMGTFLDDVEEVGPVVNRKGQIKQTVRFAGGSRPARGELDFHALALDKAGRHMEPFLIDVLPASDKEYEKSSHEGEEFLFVLSGEIELALRQGQLPAGRGGQHLLRLDRRPPRPRRRRRPRPDPGRRLRALLIGRRDMHHAFLEKTIGAVLEEQVALLPGQGLHRLRGPGPALQLRGSSTRG